ncbi:hypothetical protein [Clostridium sp. ZBS17]|uniref:hypothetical protein n=1 Tax=Clostridium sp. ZBS17 TaxID=2949968 RepID=UPI00207AA6A6|nr:hypothetical protein [Clostridium sp. ZBS17]
MEELFKGKKKKKKGRRRGKRKKVGKTKSRKKDFTARKKATATHCTNPPERKAKH